MFIQRPVFGCCDITCSIQETSHSKHHLFMDIYFQKSNSWHRILEFARNPQASNAFSHLHLKLPFYGIRGRFNITLRRKKRNVMHEKTTPLSSEKRLLAVLYMVGLELSGLSNPNSNQVTKCPMDTVLLKIIFCVTAALWFFLQYSLRTSREASSRQTVCLTQMQNRRYIFWWQCTNCHQLSEHTVRTIFSSVEANTKGDFTCSKVANITASGSWKSALSPGTAVMQRAIPSSVSDSLETWTSSWPPWLASPSYNLKQLPACPAASSSSALNSAGDC